MRNADSQSCASEYLRTCVCQSGVWSCPKIGDATRNAPKSKVEISILCGDLDPRLGGFPSQMTADIRRTNTVTWIRSTKGSIAVGEGASCVQLNAASSDAYMDTNIAKCLLR